MLNHKLLEKSLAKLLNAFDQQLNPPGPENTDIIITRCDRVASGLGATNLLLLLLLLLLFLTVTNFAIGPHQSRPDCISSHSSRYKTDVRRSQPFQSIQNRLLTMQVIIVDTKNQLPLVLAIPVETKPTSDSASHSPAIPVDTKPTSDNASPSSRYKTDFLRSQPIRSTNYSVLVFSLPCLLLC